MRSTQRSTTSKLSVLYDISVLGLAELETRARTGVFRVVDQVARQLSLRTDIDLQWSAYESSQCFRAATKLAKKDTGLSRPINPNGIGVGFANTAIATSSKMCDLKVPKLSTVAAKVKRRLEARHRYAEIRYSKFDIVHSAFYPLPKVSQPTTRVLTIYDLIAIKFPAFFDEHINSLSREILASLTPEDWVVCISDCTRADLLEYRSDLKPERVSVAPLAAGSHFHPGSTPSLIEAAKAKYGIPADCEYFLSVCTLEPP